MDYSVSFMICLSPFLIYFVLRLSSVIMLVYSILDSLTPRLFGKRGCTKLLGSFHMDWFIWIHFILVVSLPILETIVSSRFVCSIFLADSL